MRTCLQVQQALQRPGVVAFMVSHIYGRRVRTIDGPATPHHSALIDALQVELGECARLAKQAGVPLLEVPIG